MSKYGIKIKFLKSLNKKIFNTITLINQNENVKKNITKYVLENSKKIYGIIKTKQTIDEFYCDAQKVSLINSKFVDTIKIKTNLKFSNGEYYNFKIKLSDIWFTINSYGPVYTIVGHVFVNKKYLFLDNSSEDDDVYI
jgi:5-hydroxyisourate hydrolase-like protein (transthyretin family)